MYACIYVEPTTVPQHLHHVCFVGRRISLSHLQSPPPRLPPNIRPQALPDFFGQPAPTGGEGGGGRDDHNNNNRKPAVLWPWQSWQSHSRTPRQTRVNKASIWVCGTFHSSCPRKNTVEEGGREGRADDSLSRFQELIVPRTISAFCFVSLDQFPHEQTCFLAIYIHAICTAKKLTHVAYLLWFSFLWPLVFVPPTQPSLFLDYLFF